jgi:cystathionine beta-lyase
MSADDKWRRTEVVDGGRRKEWRGRLVNPPVHRASTILFDSVAEMEAARPGLGEYVYGLQGTPTQWALSEALTELEPGAAGTMLYSSGLAAITAALMSVLKAGDELLVTDNAYGPTRRFCDGVLARFGVTTRYFDPLVNGDAIESLFSDRTAAILLESPGSLTMEVQDVPAICTAARERRIATILDNTWATPLLFPAIAAGVDISVLAATKYIGGHSDVMIGAATANARYFSALERTSWDLGHALSPDDAWLGSRGLRTLAVRLRQHEESALRVANWLKARPEVGLVLHPALPDCPGHDLWKRDFKGSSGLFSFELKGADKAKCAAFVDALTMFGIGYSWGGFESLAIPVEPERTVSKPPAQNIIRLQIGLETPDDLIVDLDRAFAATA